MGYIDRLLDRNEEIVYRATVPKKLLLPTAVFLILGTLALFGGMLEIATVLLVLAGLTGIYAAVVFAGRELVVTNKRVIARVTLRRRPPWAVPLDQVTEVEVGRGPIARLLGYGTVRVKDITGTVRPVRNISQPETLKQEIEGRRRTATARA